MVISVAYIIFQFFKTLQKLKSEILWNFEKLLLKLLNFRVILINLEISEL